MNQDETTGSREWSPRQLGSHIDYNRRTTQSWPALNSPYINACAFEVINLDDSRALIGAYKNWAFALCALYITAIFWGQRWMTRNRPKPFQLQLPLTLWNVLLAVFSMVGFFRTFPELYFILSSGPNGFFNSVCSMQVHNYATAFWALAYVLSKNLEFGDTIFIVLRKKRLSFLHWYHHVSVVLVTVTTYEDYDPAFRWVGSMNYFVHGLMYSYYALTVTMVTISLKFRIPPTCSMILTLLQISQMIVGFAIGLHTANLKQNGMPCERSLKTIYLSLIIYGSYFLLFVHFFVTTYFFGGKTSIIDRKKRD